MTEEDALSLAMPDYFRVGDFLIRPTLKAIRPFHGFDAPSSAEKDRRLPDKVIAVLMKLAEQPRRVYTREELLNEVWGHDREAYDRVLDNAISELRRAFGDNARAPSYIETITKQGYRLIATVEWPERFDSKPSPTAEPVPYAPSLEEGAREVESSEAGPPEAGPPGTASANAEPKPCLDPAPESGESSTWIGRQRDRRFLFLFSLLAVILVGAAALALLVHDRSLKVALESMPNETEEDAYDGLREHLRRRLVDGGCEDSRISLTRFSFLADTRVSGAAVLEGGLIQLTADVRSHGMESKKVRATGTVGREPSRLIADLADGVLVELDRALCARRVGCHCGRLAARHLHEKDFGRAEVFLTQALATPATGSAPNPRADLWLPDLAIEIFLERGDSKAARLHLERARSIEIERDGVWWHRLERRQAQVEGAVAAELDALKTLRRLERNEPRWALALGRHYLVHGRSCGESGSHIESALNLGSDHGLLLAAQKATTCGELGQARRDLENYLGRFPESVQALVLLVDVESLSGRYQDAEMHLSRAMHLAPDYPPASLVAARLDLAQGRLTKAKEEFIAYRSAASWPRGRHDGAIGSALASLLAGEAEEALVAADIAEEAMGETAETLWVRGWAEVIAGEIEKARDYAGRIKAHCDTLGGRGGLEFHHHLKGLIASSESHWDLATDAFYDAISLNSYAKTYFRMALAKAFQQAGKLTRAREELEMLFAENPNYPPALCLFGQIRESQGDEESARDLYRRAFSIWNEPPEDVPMQECRRRQHVLDTDVRPEHSARKKPASDL